MGTAETRFDALQDRRNSLLWWYDVADVLAGMPMPRTEIIESEELATWTDCIMNGEPFTPAPSWVSHLQELAANIGYPLFLRDDQVSAKFSGRQSCLVSKPTLLLEHIEEILVYHRGQVGTPAPHALVLREYLRKGEITREGKVVKPFPAFGPSSMLPIGAERRYFVRDGKAECHHPYWPEEAIYGVQGVTEAEWKERLRLFNSESYEEIEYLTALTERFGQCLTGYWSSDFMFGSRKDDAPRWYFIDAALGDCSQHWDCPYAVTNRQY